MSESFMPDAPAGVRMLSWALARAGDHMDPGELAYLALTSKPELAIRDRLAWQLHKLVPRAVVAREWRAPGAPGRDRTDLAVLDPAGRRPLLLLELKAAYTFDFASDHLSSAGAYRERVAGDLDKAYQAAGGQESVALYGLLLLIHPHGVPADVPGTVKYGPDISRSLRGRDPGELREAAVKRAGEGLRELGPVWSGSLRGGSAFGVRVSVEWLLVKA
ncbi:hypothetical protein [Streptomyces sp. TR02-1]|uniref:hypothetical protein n=1 Tax=Streptomyces sp. TR02-1 TaxID=3385977 RepID=UPI00399F5614